MSDEKSVHKNWSYVCDHISRRLLSDKSFITHFKSLSTNAEKVSHCLSQQFVRQLLDQFLTITGSAKHQKYWEKAKEFRIEGNQCFKKKYFDDAIEAYNKVLNNCLICRLLIKCHYFPIQRQSLLHPFPTRVTQMRPTVSYLWVSPIVRPFGII